MVADLFTSLLEDLGKILKIKIKPDANNTCLLKMNLGVMVQLELDRTQEYLIMGSNLGTVPLGKYRENLFRETLKANMHAAPRRGDFAFSKQADSVVLFQRFKLDSLKAEDLANELGQFSAKTKIWSDAISKSEIPAIIYESGTSPASGMFGLSH